MNVYITYDINMFRPEFKAAMIARGYSDAWNSAGSLYRLPESCLWKANYSLDAAYNDCQQVMNDLKLRNGSADFLRLIIIPATPWKGIPGK